ncbi:hypothetical protein KAR91_67205 [Candidatus Pacearchaeota archaeon]|nr:hypothetical protein [Candidatus Pacearchaeota archaeon]
MEVKLIEVEHSFALCGHKDYGKEILDQMRMELYKGNVVVLFTNEKGS